MKGVCHLLPPPPPELPDLELLKSENEFQKCHLRRSNIPSKIKLWLMNNLKNIKFYLKA